MFHFKVIAFKNSYRVANYIIFEILKKYIYTYIFPDKRYVVARKPHLPLADLPPMQGVGHPEDVPRPEGKLAPRLS